MRILSSFAINKRGGYALCFLKLKVLDQRGLPEHLQASIDEMSSGASSVREVKSGEVASCWEPRGISIASNEIAGLGPSRLLKNSGVI